MLKQCQSPAQDSGTRPDTFDADDVLEMLKGVAEALHCVVSAQTEIVVHDIRRPDASIVEIYNGHVSGRTRNQSILAGPLEDKGFNDLLRQVRDDEPRLATVVGSYSARTSDGRELHSATTIFRNRRGEPYAALCVNADLSSARAIQRQMQGLLFPAVTTADEESEPEVTIDTTIAEIIEAAITASGIPIDSMSKSQKVEAVRAMHARGLFLIRGSVERVAKCLGTTKFTIYNYLDEIGVQRS